MGSYDKPTTSEYDLLYKGVKGMYQIVKQGAEKVVKKVKKVAQPTVPVGQKDRTQGQKTPPLTNEEYKDKMNEQYGGTMYNLVNGIFGNNGKI